MENNIYRAVKITYEYDSQYDPHVMEEDDIHDSYIITVRADDSMDAIRHLISHINSCGNVVRILAQLAKITVDSFIDDADEYTFEQERIFYEAAQAVIDAWEKHDEKRKNNI